MVEQTHLSSLVTSAFAFNGQTSGSGSAADIAGSGTSDYILVSNLGFIGTQVVK